MISKPLKKIGAVQIRITLNMISNIGIFENEIELRRFEENINHCSDTPQFMMYVVIS